VRKREKRRGRERGGDTCRKRRRERERERDTHTEGERCSISTCLVCVRESVCERERVRGEGREGDICGERLTVVLLCVSSVRED